MDNLFTLRQLADEVEKDWPSVQDKLERIHQLLLSRQNLIVNVTLGAANWQSFEPMLHDFLTALPSGTAAPAIWTPQLITVNEGLVIPAQVNYVGKGANLYRLGYKLHGSSMVITRYLRNTWLWEKVRAQGGAYGSFCQFNRHSGVLTYVSYRDPNLLDTLSVYDESANYLRQLDLTPSELEKGIIGTISVVDGYMLPDAKGYTSLLRYLLGTTDEVWQQFRDEILSTTVADFKAFADVLDGVREQGDVVVMGSQAAIAAASKQYGDEWLRVTKLL